MSKYCFVIRTAMLVAMGVCLGVPTCSMAAEPTPAARDTPEGELHNVVAKVIYPNRVDPNGLRDLSIQAQLEPGPFTIPKGYVFTKLRYHFADPKTGLEHDNVTATTIYSVTEHRYVKEAKNNPDIVLPAGEYKVVCGGLPEATGVLTYTLIREDLVKKTLGDKLTTDQPSNKRSPDALVDRMKTRVNRDANPVHENGNKDPVVIPDNCTIEMFLCYTTTPNETTFPLTLKIQNRKVAATLPETKWPAASYDNSVTRWERDADKQVGEFEGTLENNRIAGTAKYRSGPQNIRTWDRGQLHAHVVVTATVEGPMYFELRPDGTVSWNENLHRKNHNRWLVGSGPDQKTDYIDDLGDDKSLGPYYGRWQIRN